MRARLLIALFLVLITTAVYWPVVTHDFIGFDDDAYVTGNSYVNPGVTSQGVIWAFTHFHSGNWHPLTWISHMVDCQLYGLKPWGHHLTGLLFHLANTVILFLLLSWMTGSLWRSAFVAALFGVHPLHVESVAWVAERKDVLSTFFWLTTTCAYVRYVKRPTSDRFLLVCVLFILGLLSKPMLVTLPVTLLLLDYWPLGRLKGYGEGGHSAGQLIKEKVPLFLIVIPSALVTFAAQRNIGAVGALAHVPLGLRISNTVVSYVGYLSKMIWPQNLGVYYPYYVNVRPAPELVGMAILLIAISVFAYRYSGRWPYLAFGWLWYVITLIPVIGLVQVGGQSMADRYTYIPLIGIFAAIAWLVPDLLSRQEKQRKQASSRSKSAPKPAQAAHARVEILAPGAAIALMALMAATYVQVGYWHNGITLFRHTLEAAGESDVMHNNLGVELFNLQRDEEAVAEFREAVRINPDHDDAHTNMARALDRLGKLPETAVEQREVVRLHPEDANARNSLGMTLGKIGKVPESASCFQEALRLRPTFASAHSNLGVALASLGNLKTGIKECEKAVELDPGYAEANNNLGLVLARNGQVDKAIASFSKAVQLNPKYAEAQCNLGIAQMQQKDFAQALVHLSEAARIKRDYVKAHQLLAEVLTETGDYPRAWEEVRLCGKYGGGISRAALVKLSQHMPQPPAR